MLCYSLYDINNQYSRDSNNIDVSYDDINDNIDYPDSKVHGANMGPTWVLSATDGPMNFAIRVSKC